jgi:hypothetical protein
MIAPRHAMRVVYAWRISCKWFSTTGAISILSMKLILVFFFRDFVNPKLGSQYTFGTQRFSIRGLCAFLA